MQLADTKVLHKCENYWDSVVMEAVAIKTGSCNLMNRDQGFHLHKAWEITPPGYSRKIVGSAETERWWWGIPSEAESQSGHNMLTRDGE